MTGADARPRPDDPPVLVVDDHPVGRRAAEALLRQAGRRVVTATSGEAAVAVARAERPDLVLMDLRLPGISGFEAARRIRATGGLAPVRIVATSADRQARDTAAAEGLDGFLAKPLDPDSLRTILGRRFGDEDAGPPRDRPAAAPAPAVAALADLDPPIDGLDPALGLRFFAGDAGIYREALLRFVAMYRHGLPAMGAPGPASASDRRAPTIGEALHGLAGACVSIGARALANEADDLLRSTAADPKARQAGTVRLEARLVRLTLDLHARLHAPPGAVAPTGPPRAERPSCARSRS